MKTGRLEAFSDGVIAVIITIMVLELHAPREATLAAILAVLPSFLVYGLSFLMVAIMWVNHHHFIALAKRGSTPLLWANLNLLFWMSLIPFLTAWLGEHPLEAVPMAAYGLDLSLCSLSFLLLQWELSRQNPDDEACGCLFARIRIKAAAAALLYALGAALAAASPRISAAIDVLIPVAYFWPDPRMRFEE